MIVFKKAADLGHWLEEGKKGGQTIGFVPTMGALHAGHISLIDISKTTADVTVCSVFVNPTQFNDPKDFQKYPITLEKDIYLLETAGTDALFLPDVIDVYPHGTMGLEKYDLGRLETLLEGKYRPGHFQGVCQVMQRLLDLVRPDDLFMGQKDYQQCMVVRRLLEIMGSSTRLHPSPIVREADGLAMSSRNLRLTEADRKQAPAIYQALLKLREKWIEGGRMGQGPGKGDAGNAKMLQADAKMLQPGAVSAAVLEAEAMQFLERAGFRPDYISIADRATLEPLDAGGGPAVVLAAAFLGEIRLIDNMVMDE